MTTYVIRMLDQEGNLIERDETNRIIYESRERAMSVAYYIFRKYDQLYAIQGSDGSLELLSADNTQQEVK